MLADEIKQGAQKRGLNLKLFYIGFDKIIFEVIEDPIERIPAGDFVEAIYSKYDEVFAVSETADDDEIKTRYISLFLLRKATDGSGESYSEESPFEEQ